MIEKESKSRRLLSWIFEEPLAYTIPSLHLLDYTISCLSRILYILLRIFFRMVFGKNKRKHIKIFDVVTASVYLSFSFFLFMFLYKIIRKLGIRTSSLIKINVPKYKYTVYCPATIDDYINMTLREEDIIKLFNPKSGGIVIDVGAHLGRYTLISANKVGKKGKVISIEADPSVFKRLNKNLELNGFTNVISLNYAVYSTKGKIKLFFPNGGVKNTLYNTLISGKSKNSEQYIDVNANTLDNILCSTNIDPTRVNWIKIDVEGTELEVLKGATNILSKSKDIALLIEIHNVSEGKSLYENIMGLLKRYNFATIFEKIHDGGERHIIVRKQQLQ